jgi:hypothetical protein
MSWMYVYYVSADNMYLYQTKKADVQLVSTQPDPVHGYMCMLQSYVIEVHR